MKKVLLLLLLGLSGSALTSAQQSFLDSSFGNKGFLYPIINGSQKGGVTALEYSNNRILAITSGYISKFNDDGTSDLSFGTNGIYNTSSLPGSCRFFLIQPDSKILLGGDYQSGGTSTSNFFIARLLPNGGGLDASFGANGVDTIDFYGGADFAAAFALQPDGKIVMTGDSYGDIRTARCNANGSIDSSFGANGKVSTNVGYNYNQAISITVLQNGKILVAGYGDPTSSGNIDFVILKYLADGSPDTAFNHTGIVYANNNNPGYGLLRDMKVQPDGKIVLIGGSSITLSGFLVVRLNADGTKDTSFNHTGEQMIDIDGSGKAQKLALQTDGKIVIGGYYETTKENWGLIRLLSNGALDSSFGNDGKIRFPLGDRQERINDLKIQDNGKIIASGYYQTGIYPDIQTKGATVRFIADKTSNTPTVFSAEKIKIYPNPATDYIYVDNPGVQRISHIKLYSIGGKQLLTQTHPHTNKLSTEGLADGVYFLHIRLADHTTLVKKVIIQKN